MTTSQADQAGANQREQESGLLEAVVRDNVLSLLGTPSGPHRIQVKCVWGNRYRVNVYVPDGTGAFRVAHSHFVEADGNGKIREATPPITRAY